MRVNEILSVEMLWELQTSHWILLVRPQHPFPQYYSVFQPKLTLEIIYCTPLVLQLRKLRAGDMQSMFPADPAEA